jgi:acyl-CoA thioester hydrolase
MGRLFSITLKVRFYELDAFNHVNNGVFLFYLDHARDEYFEQALAGCEELPPAAIRYVVARTEVDFLIPAVGGDILEIPGQVSRFGTTSLTFDQQIVRVRDRREIVRARTVLVWTDSEGRSSPLPEAVRRAFD